MNDENTQTEERTKRICKHEGCYNELVGRQLKFCDAHKTWAAPKKTGSAKKKTAKTSKPKAAPAAGERRIKLILTLDQFAELMKKLNYPALEIEIAR